MNDQEDQLEEQATVTEQATQEQSEESQEQQRRMVPLEAMEAERQRRKQAEEQTRMLQQYLMQGTQKQQAQQEEEEDPEDILTKGQFKNSIQQAKREILEEAFVQANPQAVESINQSLEQILKDMPFLEESIKNAPNRYQRAWQIVQKFAGQSQQPAKSNQAKAVSDVQKILENSKKPGSPVAIAKSPTHSQEGYLKSIRGTKDFREYRKKMIYGKA